jgi:hypothetical protein
MKSLFKLIAEFFNYLTNFRAINRYKKINKKLGKTIEDREVDRIILKGKIIKMVRKYLKLDAKSKYIPRDYKNDFLIREKVITEYGSEMNKLGIRINSKLELI